jgi:hypothetical protein
MPYSGNKNAESHAPKGYWECCMSNKPDLKLEDWLCGAMGGVSESLRVA